MMNRSVSVVVLGVAILAVMTSESSAQFGRRGGGRGAGGPLSYIGNEAVQKDLGLNAEQTKKVTALTEELQAERQKLIAEAAAGAGDLQSLSDSERREKMGAAFSEMTKKINDKFLPKLAEILEPKQKDRLQQISWQAAGAAAYSDPEVVKALGLSKEQQDKLAALSKENQEKMRESFSGRQGTAGLAKIVELRTELEAKSKEVLSKEQQDKFEQLKGKPFDTALLRPARGQGGEEGGRPRRNRGGAEGAEKKTEGKKPE